IYEDIAIGILNSCYNEDRKRTWYLLVKEIPEFNESCITVALKTENKQFLQHQACAEVNSVSWSKYLGKDLGANLEKDLDFFSQ
ncbi:transient receptor potential cation channel subfamily M member 2, partial [Biomphalaria glabrata]